jgi:hypothetical protein
MPIADTKYNYSEPSYNRLRIDLCNNSFFYTNRTNHHIFTCDISDTLIVNSLNSPLKIYLNSKASFLIHPFSKVSNCVTQFSSNNNSAFKYKKPIPCPITGPTSHNAIQTQKAIQNVLHTSSSNFTQVLSSLTTTTDISRGKPWHNASDRAQKHGTINANSSTSQKINSGVDIKHNSYARYLAKKKGVSLRTELSSAPIALMGNKTKYYSISTHELCKATC